MAERVDLSQVAWTRSIVEVKSGFRCPDERSGGALFSSKKRPGWYSNPVAEELERCKGKAVIWPSVTRSGTLLIAWHHVKIAWAPKPHLPLARTVAACRIAKIPRRNRRRHDRPRREKGERIVHAIEAERPVLAAASTTGSGPERQMLVDEMTRWHLSSGLTRKSMPGSENGSKGNHTHEREPHGGSPERTGGGFASRHGREPTVNTLTNRPTPGNQLILSTVVGIRKG